MFTGIIEELGQIVATESRAGDSARLRVRGPLVTSDAAPGNSIAVDGVCLTVVERSDGTFSADVMKETLDRSGLGARRPGDPVNLERAMAAGGRFGGHVVQGHVDATARLLERRPSQHWEVLRFCLPPQLARYVVVKGSITVDGVSLTVAAVDQSSFSVSLVPATLQRTTLGVRAVGERVNLEVDVLAKYVEKMLATTAAPGRGDSPAEVGR